MPCAVQAARSRWLVLRPVWLMNRSPGRRSMICRVRGTRCCVSTQRVAPGDLLDHTRRVGVGLGMDDDLVLLQSGIGTGPAKDIGVVVNHGNLHAVGSLCTGFYDRGWNECGPSALRFYAV